MREHDNLFSDEHTEIFNLATSIIPRLHLFVLAGLIILNLETVTDYVMEFGRLMIDQDALMLWFQLYGPFVLVVGLVAGFFSYFVLYLVFWRLIFPDYYVVLKDQDGTEINDVPDGRLYWTSFNWLYAFWDRHIWRTTATRPREIWVCEKSMLNPINPPMSCSVIRLRESETVEKVGLFKAQGREYARRHRTGLRSYVTVNEGESTLTTPNELSVADFGAVSSKIIRESRDLVKANADIRSQQTLRANFPIPEGLRKACFEDLIAEDPEKVRGWLIEGKQ